MDVYAELSDTNPNWKKVYADYANFRRDQNLWFRFCEAQLRQLYAVSWVVTHLALP